MAFVDLIPKAAFKRLENWARKGSFIMEPAKRWMGGYAPFPWAVIAHLTYRCNLDCSMCCQHIPDYTEILPGFPKPGIGNEEMNILQWKGVLDDIASSFPILPFFHFSGGEPFLYSGLMDLVIHAKQRGYSLSIITNGWMLNQYAGLLVEHGVNRLHISIDGTEELHDRIRRREGSYRRAIQGIQTVMQERAKRNKHHPHVTINCTITPENHNQLDHLLKVREEAGADHLTIQHLVFFDHEREMAEGIDTDLLKEQLQRLRKRKEITIYAHVPDRRIETYYRGPSSELGKGCGWNWVGLRLHPNGDVVPCREVNMGNIADGNQSLKTIWNSAEYTAMRRELIRIGNFVECSRCTHRMF